VLTARRALGCAGHHRRPTDLLASPCFLDGFEMIRRCATIRRPKQIPVVVLTGATTDFRAGAQARASTLTNRDAGRAAQGDRDAAQRAQEARQKQETSERGRRASVASSRSAREDLPTFVLGSSVLTRCTWACAGRWLRMPAHVVFGERGSLLTTTAGTSPECCRDPDTALRARRGASHDRSISLGRR